MAYQDDASRLITGYGVFCEATAKNAITVLHKAIKRSGKPASILTARKEQFYSSESESKKGGASEFEKELVKLEIRHLLVRANHSQTSGKLRRFYGEVQLKLHRFVDMDELVQWWNEVRPHMSLDWDNMETPAKAFWRKMPPDDMAVME